MSDYAIEAIRLLLITWLSIYDATPGCYTDDAMISEGWKPLTFDQVIEAVHNSIQENK